MHSPDFSNQQHYSYLKRKLKISAKLITVLGVYASETKIQYYQCKLAPGLKTNLHGK